MEEKQDIEISQEVISDEVQAAVNDEKKPRENFKVASIIVPECDVLLDMMHDSMLYYDQALFFQRNEYFKTNNRKEGKYGPYKRYTADELVKILRNCLNTDTRYSEKKRSMHTKAIAYISKQVVSQWKGWLSTMKDYKKEPEKYKTMPQMPKYLHRRKKYNVVRLDKDAYVWVSDNKIRLYKTDYVIELPSHLNSSNVRMIIIQKYYNKIKINVVYVDKEEKINNAVDEGSAMGIDLGVNNFCAITINDKDNSYIIKGGGVKSLNQLYNKNMADIKSKLEKCNKRKVSKRTNSECMHRTRRMYEFIHTVANKIIDLALENRVGSIVIGHNPGWKQDVNLGKVNNQKFVSIPFNDLINALQYKVEKYVNLKLIVTEENHTSKCDHLAKEEVCHHDTYKGKRKTRGLFVSSIGKIINADINGAIGILRKVHAFTDAQLMRLRDRGDIVSPKVLRIINF